MTGQVQPMSLWHPGPLMLMGLFLTILHLHLNREEPGQLIGNAPDNQCGHMTKFSIVETLPEGTRPNHFLKWKLTCPYSSPAPAGDVALAGI